MYQSVDAVGRLNTIQTSTSVVSSITGKSFRAFHHRFLHHLHGNPCLSYHEAGTWWQYEWCIGKNIHQYHKHNETYQETILLGRFHNDTSRTIDVRSFPNHSKPKVYDYYGIQMYSHGAICPLTGLERNVSIHYKCCIFRANQTYIESIHEPIDCHYRLSVCSPLACQLYTRDQTSLAMEETERLSLLKQVKSMFYHAYEGYLKHAYPLDTLCPLSCTGQTFELGSIPLLTLIDTLDTLAILEDRVEFQKAVSRVIKHVNFAVDTEVSVFETTIRVLGGLLSAHLLAKDPTLGLYPIGMYQNELLALAKDLGDRLLPAFSTPTGIPYGTVNLLHGVPEQETKIASTAGAGSLSMEFTMLSILTNDLRYVHAARGAVRGLFQRRSQLNLLGKHINIFTGEWTETISGPGSNSDSFYEYLWKMYILYGDMEAYEMFQLVYPAVEQYNRHGDWYTDVSMYTGCHHGSVIVENLVAFWPGMETSQGYQISSSESTNALYRVWREYGFLPEQFNVNAWKPVNRGARYPLRPELIESTFYLHEMTKDSSWLRAGAHVIDSIETYTKTSCGYASVNHIETKELEDSMPSFFLSETLKYLYLLFNTTHFIRNGNYVLTTEAHPFSIPSLAAIHSIQLPTSQVSSPMCLFVPFWQPMGYNVEYKTHVIKKTSACQMSQMSSSKGSNPSFFDLFDVDLAYDPIPSRFEKATSDSSTRSPPQYLHSQHGMGHFRIDKMKTSLRITREETGEYIETTSLAQGEAIIGLAWLPEHHGEPEPSTPSQPDDQLAFQLPYFRFYEFISKHKVRRTCQLTFYLTRQYDHTIHPHVFSCGPSAFGHFAQGPSLKYKSQQFHLMLASPLEACGPLTNQERIQGKIVVIRRGTCYFERKAREAMKAGASGVIVVNTDEEDTVMVMSGSGTSDNEPLVEIPVVMVPRRVGDWIHRQLMLFGDHVQASIALETIGRSQEVERVTSYLTQHDSSLEKTIYPRMERTQQDMMLYTPTWGVRLHMKKDTPHELTIELLDTSQTIQYAQQYIP